MKGAKTVEVEVKIYDVDDIMPNVANMEFTLSDTTHPHEPTFMIETPAKVLLLPG